MPGEIKQIAITIDSHLSLPLVALPEGIIKQICERLTIQEIKDDVILQSVELWRREGSQLIMPRGFAAELRVGLEAMGYSVSWVDNTVAPALSIFWLHNLKQPKLWPDQERAAREVLRHRQGVLQAPTSAGKTVTGLECWRRVGTTGLVLVDKIGLADQWRHRALEHLGVETGFIGDGSWSVKQLTIAMVPTLYRRRDTEDAKKLLSSIGMVLADEVHHGASESYRTVLQMTRSRYLIGKTATPLDGDWYQPILLNTIGPIFHVTSDAELRETGRRVKPVVKVVKTTFEWLPRTRREERLVDPKAIYRYIIAALEEDKERMALIVGTIANQDESCAQLVVSSRLGYIEQLREGLIAFGYLPEERIVMMRGQESKERRQEIAEMANEGSIVILSTVAKEGIDIPRLDRLHLVWPQRRALTITQQIGRVLRAHPDKNEAEIFDYADMKQGVFRSQHFSRRKVYNEAGYKVLQEDRTTCE